ncbi:MAG TPA: hypothetical protein PLM53_07095 [Spirochaetota bacterium]|nr:hypothetical protein [Spirochaetota bacterium]HPC40818.1 hypothetical protein [Spirochaetota bacterium]HPL18379.1 hypothetical protein [Spirochaetota bacterium]HQF07792.1 hypothetical protein [Spirochaetota bacterium]HQH96845.1 hypothetical protein [Spirochaetota bacterium]
MTEQQPQHESLAEQTIRRYRSPESLQRTEKRRRFSAIIFVVNIVLIMVLYLFYAGDRPRDLYQSSTFNYGDLQFRFSVMKERNTGNYIFSLTTRSAPGKQAFARFNNGIADLVVAHGSTVLVKMPVGKEVAALALKPGDMDLQKVVIDRVEMNVYTDGHPEYVVSPRRSLLSPDRPYIPLTAEITIHADRPVSTTLKFKHEVDQ